jgi:hypothetical protein
MHCEEITQITVKMAPRKKRDAKEYWDLDRRPELKGAVETCLVTGQEQFVCKRGDMILYHVRPEYPLIESAMAEDRNKSLKKVTINMYTAALNMGVRG